PHAVVYKPSFFAEWFFKLLIRIRYPGPVGLVNLVAGWKKGDPYIAREILMDEVSAESLAEECYALLSDVAKRDRMKADFARLRRTLGWGEKRALGPSATAASEIFEVLKCPVS